MASSDGASRSPSLDPPNSVALPWMRDQPHAETSTWQHTTLTRETRPCPRRDLNPQSQQPRGHWNRQNTSLTITDHRRREQMSLPERHTNTRTGRERFIPYVFYKLGSLLLSILFSIPALCQYDLLLYFSSLNSYLYSAWDESEQKAICCCENIPLCGPQQRVKRTLRITHHSLHALSLKETRRHKCSAFGVSVYIVLNSGCISDLCFHLLTIKIHNFYRYMDDSMLFWVRTEFGLLLLTNTKIKLILILIY